MAPSRRERIRRLLRRLPGAPGGGRLSRAARASRAAGSLRAGGALLLAAALAAVADGGPAGDPMQGGEPVAAAAEETSALPRAGARPFETWEWAAEGGVLLPLGGLDTLIPAAPLLGARLATSYYGPWRATGALAWARLEPEGGRADLVHHVSAAAGLEWRPPSPWIPGAGAALVLHYLRAGGEDPDRAGYLFLEDGESEFGVRAGLRWALPLAAAWSLSLGIAGDLVFSGPEYSRLATLHLGAAWTP